MEDLHLKAGLTFSGKNAEGENEYIGTSQQWDKYEELDKNEAMKVMECYKNRVHIALCKSCREFAEIYEMKVSECMECGQVGHHNPSCVKSE